MPEEKTDVATDVAAVEQPITETDSSPVEEQVASDTAQAEESQAEVSNEQSNDTEGEKEEVAPGVQVDDLKPKSQNRFQDLANRNRELEQKLREMSEFQAPTKDDYIAGGYDESEARINALEAKLAQGEALGQVKQLNLAVDNDMVRVLSEYPELSPSSSKFNEKLAQNLMAQYDRDAQAEYSEDGIVLSANQMPYEYIKSKMDLLNLATKQERVTAQRNVEKMVAAAETPTGQAPTSESETLDQMRERLSSVKF